MKQYLFIFRQRRVPYFIPKYRFLCLNSLCLLVTESPGSTSEWRLKATPGSFSRLKIVFGPNWRERKRPTQILRVLANWNKLLLWYFQCFTDDWFLCTFSVFIYSNVHYISETIFKHKLTCIAISKDKTSMMDLEIHTQYGLRDLHPFLL